MAKLTAIIFWFLLLDALQLVPSTGGVVYYVTPSLTSSRCPGQPCHTLQYYFDRVHTAINEKDNVTMLFMSGTHSVNIKGILIQVPIIKMVGERQNVLLKTQNKSGHGWITFIGVSEVYLTNLVMDNWSIFVQMVDTAHSSYFEMTAVKLLLTQLTITVLQARLIFKESEFHNGSISVDTAKSLVTMANCTLKSNPTSIQNSTLELKGTSQLTNSNLASAISTYFSNITMSGRLLLADNSGIRGGAMALYSSTLHIAPDTEVMFINNSALETGGAIYINPGLTPQQLLSIMVQNTFSNGIPSSVGPKSFYRLLNCTGREKYTFSFKNNTSSKGGDDIYGASLHFHQNSPDNKCNLTVTGVSAGISSVSSDPTRVCLCDRNGKPQCENNSFIYRDYAVCPGEVLTVAAVVVGGDFGATIGQVYADFVAIDNPGSSPQSLTSKSQHVQVVTNSKLCSELNYSLNNYTHGKTTLFLTTVYVGTTTSRSECIDDLCFHTTPVFLNVTLLPCPPGLTLLGEFPVCSCNPVLSDNSIECQIIDGKGVFSWTGSLWVNISEENILYSQYCPFNHCRSNMSQGVDLQNDSDTQCNFNRAGRLCGGCQDDYSLAIGSSHCIHCTTNNNLALLIFFAAAGLLLVLFISSLNLTVTQGTIDGLVFYANILCIYQSLFFREEDKTSTVLVFLKTFIAWVNLDFGIETCFVSGLTAFWKTWLQYIFPLYIWTIAGLIIVAARYSTRLTNLLGDRAVPVLDTLFLLSYMKLLRLVATTMVFSTITESQTNSVIVVWSVDGNLTYFGFPHILLFLAGLATLLFLGLPYTFLLFLMQWLRRLPRSKLLKWLMRFHPVYDAYFAPLKHKHQYWFGVLLLTRGILLVTFASTFTVPQNINLLLLLVSCSVLLFYMAQTHPYKTKSLRLLHSSFLLNLTILSGFVIFTQTHPNGPALRSTAVGLSTGIAFLQFCGIVIHALVAPIRYCKRREIMPSKVDVSHSIVEPVADFSESTGYRDSILDDDETQPLITNDSNAKYRQIE